MRSLVLTVCVALCGCGPGSSRSQESRLALALAEGAEIRANTGEVTLVPLIVFGAEGRAVTWSVDGAPAYVAVANDGLRIAPPRAELAGTFDVVLTASAGVESVSRTIRLVIERVNSAPIVMYWTFVDASAWGWCSEAGYDATPLATVACLDRLGLRGSLADPTMVEPDAAGVEVEAVLADAPLTGTPTHRSDLRSDWGLSQTGRLVPFEVALDGLEPGRPYRIAVRGYDALGATEAWRQLPQPVVIAPYVLRPQGYALGNATGALCVVPGSTATFGFVAGALPPGTSIAVSGLSQVFAPHVNGDALTVTMPAGTPLWNPFPFDVSLPFGEVVMTQRTFLSACPFQGGYTP